MKILYITSADFDRTDAPTVRARGLARALAAEGCRVDVLGINGQDHNGEYLYRRIAYPAVRRIGQLAYQAGLAWRLMENHGYDRILLRETPYCVQPYLLGLPVFLEVNGLALPDATPMAASLYRWGYRRAEGIFALTPALREYTVREGAPPERVHAVSNAVEVDRLYPVDRTEARRALGLPEMPIIFYVGSYHRQHGLENVLKAAGRVNWLFLMAGQGDAALRAQAPPGKFRFLGRIDDDTLRMAIGAADVCLNPAGEATRQLTDATFPQKVLEYMACARPVISMGDAPAVRAVLEGAGVVIPATPDALVSALSADFSGMGERGRARVLERFTYRQIVQQYLEHLK